MISTKARAGWNDVYCIFIKFIDNIFNKNINQIERIWWCCIWSRLVKISKIAQHLYFVYQRIKYFTGFRIVHYNLIAVGKMNNKWKLLYNMFNAFDQIHFIALQINIRDFIRCWTIWISINHRRYRNVLNKVHSVCFVISCCLRMLLMSTRNQL